MFFEVGWCRWCFAFLCWLSLFGFCFWWFGCSVVIFAGYWLFLFGGCRVGGCLMVCSLLGLLVSIASILEL